MIEDDPEGFHDGPSKSELKRLSQKLQELGEELVVLPQNEFDELPLPDNLREAVALARRITAHGGLYRQKQYIGKLMRTIDAEPIRAALESRNVRQRAETLKLRRIESLRAQLIDSEGPGLDALLVPYPQLDRRTVLRLVAQARSERDRGQPPRAARELFGMLRNGLE